MTDYRPLWFLAVCIVGAVSRPAHAQDRPPRQEMNCDDLPRWSPHPRDLGLAEALARASRRELSRDALGYALDWAGREPNPALVPVLKQIVEADRCSANDVALAFYAIEATGEPSEYFLAYALEWEHDDAIAASAFDALSVRDVPTVRPVLAAVVAAAPERARYGSVLSMDLMNYDNVRRLDAQWASKPTDRTLQEVAEMEVGAAGGAILLRNPRGQLYVSLMENETRHYPPGVLARRYLRRLARVYPSATAAALGAARESVRTVLFGAGHSPTTADMILNVVSPMAQQVAFPSDAPPLPPEVTAAAVAASVCVEERVGPLNDGETRLVAAFSYDSQEPSGVRVAYGALNEVKGAAGVLPPEVFIPAADTSAEHRFRVALAPGDSVRWTLLGQTATATDATRRCDAPPVPACGGQTATVYVGDDGRIVGGPLAGRPYAGRLDGTAGDDVIVGTDAADLLLGLAGSDTLCGAAGDDALVGGPGADTADGGDGTDGCNAETAVSCEGPVPPLRRVEPLAGCVALRPDGRYTAYFGYDNGDAHPGQIVHGTDNRVVLRPFDRVGEEVVLRPVSPEWFAVPGVVPGAPGRTAPFPESAFSVTVGAGDAVVWDLLGQAVTLSPDSPRCPD